VFKQPIFTAVVVVTLALGIGANTAIFTVVNAVVLQPLPFQEADRLTMIWTTRDANQEQPLSFADYNDLRAQTKSFSAVGAASPLWHLTLTGGEEPEPLEGLFVSANMFELLRVSPASGRNFTAEEDRIGGTSVAIISHSLWERRYGSDPNVLGKPITINGVNGTIIGVMPAGFQVLEPAAEVWLPLSQNQFAASARNVRLLSVVGRLNNDVNPAAANAELNTIASQWAGQYPDFNSGVGLRVVPLHCRPRVIDRVC
jgi:hypothetical protein